MVNEGRLAPVVDVVQALRDEAAGAGNNAKGASGKGGVGGDDVAKGSGNKGSARKDVSCQYAPGTALCVDFSGVLYNLH